MSAAVLPIAPALTIKTTHGSRYTFDGVSPVVPEFLAAARVVSSRKHKPTFRVERFNTDVRGTAGVWYVPTEIFIEHYVRDRNRRVSILCYNILDKTAQIIHVGELTDSKSRDSASVLDASAQSVVAFVADQYINGWKRHAAELAAVSAEPSATEHLSMSLNTALGSDAHANMSPPAANLRPHAPRATLVSSPGSVTARDHGKRHRRPKATHPCVSRAHTPGPLTAEDVSAIVEAALHAHSKPAATESGSAVRGSKRPAPTDENSNGEREPKVAKISDGHSKHDSALNLKQGRASGPLAELQQSYEHEMDAVYRLHERTREREREIRAEQALQREEDRERAEEMELSRAGLRERGQLLKLMDESA